MKRLMLGSLVMLAAVCLADTATEYAKFTASRRYCVKREQVGDLLITHWNRAGKPDWILPSVETNRVRTIAGKEQNNPLQNKIVQLNQALADLNTRLQSEIANYAAASNRAESAEKAVTAAKSGLMEEREKWQTKYNSASSILKPVYKLGLDLIDGILAKMEGTAE